MHIISTKALRDFSKKYPDCKTALDSWIRLAKSAKWNHIIDVKEVYPSADAVEKLTVFNIKGNNFRLITSIDYSKKIIFIKYILTHSDYDLEYWKNDPYHK
jgi:mRNA interferase HigB